ncbi:MAG: endonuclease/exonuclease/phosphatase family protein [Planctomycetaceae bacterium]
MGSWKTGKFFVRIAPILSMGLVAVWALGQILRDRNWWTGLMFYVPSPGLVTWLLLMLIISRTSRCLTLGLLIAPLAMLLGVENQWIRPDNPGTETVSYETTASHSVADRVPMRLIHWNLAQGAMGWEKQWRHIESLDPDIIVLSEIPELFDAARLTGFDVLVIDGMAVACHGSMTKRGPLVRGGALQAWHVTCQLSAGTLEVMIADMTSRIGVPRDPYLRPFVALLADRKIDVSVGDFNAPRRSLAFGDLPAGYRHAYDAAGAGWSYTWPVPVPFLAIDQCMVGPRLKPVHYELQSTVLSDHRLQILDFEWLPED